MIDGRWVIYAIWGIGTTIVWAKVLTDAYGEWRERHDQRAKRELLSRAALFTTALASSASIWMILYGQPGSTPRTFLLALALGMFTGAGIVIATMRKGGQ